MAGVINERASTSTDIPLTPSITMLSSEMRYLANDMYQKVSVYLQGQIESTIDEYKLLEEMNNVTGQRYDDMKKVASNVASKLTLLNGKYESLRPYLQQIDEIDENTRRLEEAATMLDQYVTALENKLRSVQVMDVISPR
ncbi:hypothetical protein AB6A40_000874 [Gnathostoma spinigerum]|uniref:Biogenesis of lysosome-related organelles complex 1 subunit 2 n=1 Tax=Gnathostoma spinigerum TaxID=75299 RepID=A0ABD6E2X9_9BILA